MARSATFSLDSCVRGYHVYKDIWNPAVGDELPCLRESDNAADRYAVAMKKDDAIVGQVPRKISRVCSLFLARGGSIQCVVTGNRRPSVDLPQGGLQYRVS